MGDMLNIVILNVLSEFRHHNIIMYNIIMNINSEIC